MSNVARLRKKSPRLLSFITRRKEGFHYWDVKPSGDYGNDYATGQRLAQEFLQSCDGTVGWDTLLTCIVYDIIEAGSINRGVIAGFTRALGEELSYAQFMRGKFGLGDCPLKQLH